MFSPIAQDYIANPRNRGPLENFTHVGQVGTPGEGSFVTIWLIVSIDNIERAAYATHGCLWSVACASMLCELATGRPIHKVRDIDAHDIDVLLGGIPEGKGEFAVMSVTALMRALEER